MQSYCKLTFGVNDNSILHRWVPPSPKPKTLEEGNPDHYFVQNKSSSAFLKSLWSVKSHNNIMQHVLAAKLFKGYELRCNYAFDIFHLNLNSVFECRIISCFYKSDVCSIQNVYWNLFLDHLNMHIFVTSELMRKVMDSSQNGIIVALNLDVKALKKLSTQHLDMYISKKATTIISIDRQTLNSYFKYDNNVIELKNPSLLNGKLIFSQVPHHVGDGILLSRQCSSFKMENNEHILKLHKKPNKKSHKKIQQSRLIIVCQKHELNMAVNNAYSNIYLNFVSVSQPEDNNDSQSMLRQQCNSHFKDDYAILLIATNPKRSSNLNKYALFSKETTDLLTTTRNPNMESNNGDKHNASYGKYYGFGIINHYEIKQGISFGQFRRLKDNNKDKQLQIINDITEHFSSIAKRLDCTVKGCVEAGNNQISSLINYGRQSTFNPTFLSETNSKNFLLNDCFSMWLCKNARTEEFHTEIDASYTMIGIPIVKDDSIERKECTYKFQFRWNPIEDQSAFGVDIGLFDGLALFYNGIALHHRQVPCSEDYNDSTFWNLSMYHNNRLFNSICQSMNRI